MEEVYASGAPLSTPNFTLKSIFFCRLPRGDGDNRGPPEGGGEGPAKILPSGEKNLWKPLTNLTIWFIIPTYPLERLVINETETMLRLLSQQGGDCPPGGRRAG